jgi:hypothetical protein
MLGKLGFAIIKAYATSIEKKSPKTNIKIKKALISGLELVFLERCDPEPR